VAVEFVHPVIVGKRALPAVHVEGADLVGGLRLLVRPGDCLLAVGTAAAPGLSRLMRYAEAWGLVRIWLGAGPRPAHVPAEHVLWVQGPTAEEAARAGDLVLGYHLLWELTHVVFEHPGLLDESETSQGAVCITCSDQGRPAEIRAVGPGPTAQVRAGRDEEAVDISLIDPVRPGDLVLVHAGVALTVLEAEEL
jgi:hydrogenase maturation factor